MLEFINAPAWIYWFVRRGYPARGAAAWILLDDLARSKGLPEDVDRTIGGARAVRFLAEKLGVTATMARLLLRQGENIFWRRRGPLLLLFCEDRLWRNVGQAITISREARMPVPVGAFAGRLGTLRAWLARGSLSRGLEKPVSRAYSAGLLNRSTSTITEYRRHLKSLGGLAIFPQYRDEGQEPPRARPEFSAGGRTLRRLPDIVLLLAPNGQILDILAKNDERGPPEDLQPRRYFQSVQEYVNWEARDREVDPQAVVYDERSARWTKIFPAYRERTSERERESTLSSTSSSLSQEFSLNTTQIFSSEGAGGVSPESGLPPSGWSQTFPAGGFTPEPDGPIVEPTPQEAGGVWA